MQLQNSPLSQQSRKIASIASYLEDYSWNLRNILTKYVFCFVLFCIFCAVLSLLVYKHLIMRMCSSGTDHILGTVPPKVLLRNLSYLRNCSSKTFPQKLFLKNCSRIYQGTFCHHHLETNSGNFDCVQCEVINPTLDTRISVRPFVRSSILLRHAQGTPPGALVKD